MTDSTLATTDLTPNDALAILGILGAFVFILLAIGIIWYLFQAMGLYRMAKKRNMEHKWFAWIPYLQNYLFGELIEDKVWGISGAKWILIFGPILSTIAGNYIATSENGIVITLLSIYTIAFYVYLQCAYYRLYKEYSTHAVALTVFSIIFPFLAPVFIFAIRNNQFKPIKK